MWSWRDLKSAEIADQKLPPPLHVGSALSLFVIRFPLFLLLFSILFFDINYTELLE